MNKTKKKQTHIHREQTSGYQWREGKGEGQYKDRGKRVIIELCEIMHGKLLKIVKRYRI